MKRAFFAAGLLLLCAAVRAEEAPPTADAKTIGEFRAWCGAKVLEADKADSIVIPGKDNWLFLAGELRHVSVGNFWGEAAQKVSRASKPEWADPLPVILDFKAQLDKAGIELVLAPVPPKAFIYPDRLTDAIKPPPPRLDSAHQEFYKLLTEKGVAVLDLAGEMLKERQSNKPDQQALYCKTDTHWSPYACQFTARLLKSMLAGRAWLPAARQVFASENKNVEVTGDLETARGGAGKETLAVRVLCAPEATAVDPNSPILLLGDSHCLVFHAGDDMLGTNFGLVDQLAIELGMPIDLLGVRGSGVTPARITLLQRVKANDKYLAGKKLLIWCFTARDFTEAQGWRLVPVVK
jgi:alginate O-acetyltransferase complex protein AlgJ